MEDTRVTFKSQGDAIKRLEIQMGDIANQLQHKAPNTFPSNSITNPNAECKAISVMMVEETPTKKQEVKAEKETTTIPLPRPKPSSGKPKSLSKFLEPPSPCFSPTSCCRLTVLPLLVADSPFSLFPSPNCRSSCRLCHHPIIAPSHTFSRHCRRVIAVAVGYSDGASSFRGGVQSSNSNLFVVRRRLLPLVCCCSPLVVLLSAPSPSPFTVSMMSPLSVTLMSPSLSLSLLHG
ncbi:hypothetical protein PIB30_033258 [Stylosanthes scabra]|uniref:Uncharacterized protein n=1 Tax=Stylosanthes scabra TaxID=79078 RepID=A0ABU6YEV3_9FABA|nr:hypothetical protein [Stylosanthes scabra]